MPQRKRPQANVDILVNNAGITRDGLMMRMKDEDWDAVMDINLKAAMVLSRASMRAMMKGTLGTDHPDFVDCQLYGQPRSGQLRCRQGWYDRLYQGIGS